jgi:hypothetical protein
MVAVVAGFRTRGVGAEGATFVRFGRGIVVEFDVEDSICLKVGLSAGLLHGRVYSLLEYEVLLKYRRVFSGNAIWSLFGFLSEAWTGPDRHFLSLFPTNSQALFFNTITNPQIS